MRHLAEGRKLGRTASHRKATLASLSIALIHERRIVTTVAKAKELRRYVEPLITRAKVDSTHNRRQVFSKLQDKYAVTELFEEIGPLAKDRPGGYTRVLKMGYRQGDSAELAMIELVDYNDHPPEIRETGKKKTRRAGRSKKTTSAEPVSDKKKTDELTEETTAAETEQAEVKSKESADETPEAEADQKEVESKETADDSEKEAKSQEDEDVKSQESQADEDSEPTETEQSKAKAEGKDEAEPEEKKAKDKEAKAEEKSSAPETGDTDSTETAGDYTVEEVKEKLEGMSLDEARAFVGDDERVTVQRALQKMIDDASEDDK